MAELMRVKMRWQGFQGAPGYSVFHFQDQAGDGSPATVIQGMVDAAHGRIWNFANNIKTLLPNVVQLVVEPDVEVIESTDGRLLDVRTAPSKVMLTGSAGETSVYSAASGAVINWRTAVVRKRRRIRGRTFVVPLASTCYETNGTLNTSCMAILNTEAATLTAQTTEPDLGIYARPTRTKNTDGTWKTNSDGEWAVVRSHTVPDMTAVLRSRRD